MVTRALTLGSREECIGIYINAWLTQTRGDSYTIFSGPKRGSARHASGVRARGPWRPPATPPAPRALGPAWARSWAVLRALEAAVGPSGGSEGGLRGLGWVRGGVCVVVALRELRDGQDLWEDVLG